MEIGYAMDFPLRLFHFHTLERGYARGETVNGIEGRTISENLVFGPSAPQFEDNRVDTVAERVLVVVVLDGIWDLSGV